jgi:hypothetical protein
LPCGHAKRGRRFSAQATTARSSYRCRAGQSGLVRPNYSLKRTADVGLALRSQRRRRQPLSSSVRPQRIALLARGFSRHVPRSSAVHTASLRASAGLRSIRDLRRLGFRSSRAVEGVPCASCAPERLRYARCRSAAQSREAVSASWRSPPPFWLRHGAAKQVNPGWCGLTIRSSGLLRAGCATIVPRAAAAAYRKR